MKKVMMLLVMMLGVIANVKAEVVFSGEHNVGNWDAQQLPVGNYAVLAKANAGDVIAVTLTAVEDGARITLQDTDWQGMVDEYNCAVGKHYFALTEAMATKLREGGLIVTGEKYTFDKVELLYKKTLWEGIVDDNTGWGQSDALANGLFAGLEEGSVLGIDVTAINDGASWHQMALRVDYADNMIAASTNEAKTMLYELTAEQVTTLQTRTINVIAQYLCVSALYTYVDDKSTLLPLTLSVPVTQDWVYSGKPSITIHVENGNDEEATCNAVVTIVTDKQAAVAIVEKSETVAANSNGDIVLTTADDLSAGIYKATCTVNGTLAREFFFAIDPTSIVSTPDKQADFDTFWNTAKSQLDAIDINATLTEIPSKSTAARKVYLVEMQSVPDGTSGDPVIIRGYYCEPQDGKKHPVIMHYLGYDSGYRPGGQDAMPYCPSGDAEPDYAEFYLSCRGQSINNRPAADRSDGIDRDFENTYGDWFAFNFGNKDSYYYRGAYMDCVRAIDFMASRETSEMDQLYAEGQSQGGAFTVAAAALSGRTFKAIAPAITFMGDFPDYFDITNWPASVARENQGSMTDDEMFAFLSYFDTKNLATRISCPTITSVGLQDNVCPAHTNLAPYNNVTTAEADKQIVFNAELQHQVNSDWYTTYMNFFDSYAPTASEDAEVIWEGTQATGNWADYVNLSYNDRAKCADALMTDVIRITFTTTADGAQIQLSNPAKGWAKFSDEAGKDVDYSTEAQTFEYAIAKAAILEDVQLTGIIVAGKNIEITKVELVKTAGRYDAASITIGADGIATYSTSKKLDLVGTGVKAYYASGVETGIITLTSTTTLWGYQGYVVKGDEGTYDIPVTEEAEYPSTNYLKATADYAADLTASAEGEYRYIFAKKDEKIGFFKLASAYTLAAHKAYLETATDVTPTSGNARIALIFDDDTTTGIANIDHSTFLDEPSGRAERNMEHSVYDLMGRRMESSIFNGQSSIKKKGLYIHNGKKYIVK